MTSEARNEGSRMKKYQVWTCKIVVHKDATLPNGFDAPPRRAAIDAVERAGIDVINCYSGWGGELTPTQENVTDEAVARRSSAEPHTGEERA